MKVLMSAYACEPGKGSEPAVGWNWARSMARTHQVWVITRSNNREGIENALVGEQSSIRWVYYDLPRWLGFWKRGRRGLHIYYYLWQIGAFFRALRLHHAERFDAVHHATFVMYWMPSFMTFLGVPFLWGPVGGGDNAPIGLIRTLSGRGQWSELARYVVQRLASLDPFLRLTARRSSFAFAATPATAERLRRLGAQNVIEMSQVALPTEEIEELGKAPIRTDKPFRVLSMGDLIDLKGFHLGLRGFLDFASSSANAEYWVVGDGPRRADLEAIAGRAPGEVSTTFFGRLERSDALERLKECDVLLHPSLHDSGGWVCAEAMAAGKPVICLDIGGPGLQVDSSVGYAIRPGDPDRVIADITAALRELESSTGLRKALGAAGRMRVNEQYTWRSKAESMQRYYLEARRKAAAPEASLSGQPEALRD